MELRAKVLVFVVVTLISVTSTIADVPNYSQNERIRKKVLENYDKNALPHKDENGTTTVYFGLALDGFRIEEDKQILNINARLLLEWHDPRLMWDYKDYGGVKALQLADSEAWKPDISLYNNADATEVDPYGNVHLVVKSSGKVSWLPPATFRSECPLDLTLWPYDKQTCDLSFGSWSTHGWEINLDLKDNQTKPFVGWFLKNSNKWKYLSGKMVRLVLQFNCCPEPYYVIDTHITIQRYSPSYVSIVFVPAVVISLLTLLQFLLPLRATKRITIGCVSALLTLLTLFSIANTVPSLANSVPIIVKFYGQTLVVVLLSIGIGALILRLTETEHPAASTPPPPLLKTLLTGPMGSVMLLQKYMDKVGHSGGGDAEVLEEVRPVSYAHEWLLVAAAVDRLASVAFVAIFVFTLIAYSAVL